MKGRYGEPWEADRMFGILRGGPVRGAGREQVAHINTLQDDEGIETRQSRALRAMTCVNLFDGIPNPKLFMREVESLVTLMQAGRTKDALRLSRVIRDIIVKSRR
jgi:hypothetical protein